MDGRCSLHDVRGSIAKVAVGTEPKMFGAEAIIAPCVAGYEALAPIVTQAFGDDEPADCRDRCDVDRGRRRHDHPDVADGFTAASIIRSASR